VRQLALQNDLPHRPYDNNSPARKALATDQTNRGATSPCSNHPGIGDYLGLTSSTKSATSPLSQREGLSKLLPLVKGTVACRQDQRPARANSQSYLRWAFGEAAIIAKRDALLAPRQRLETRLNNKFKANTVLAIKLPRRLFMLKTKTSSIRNASSRREQ